MISASRPPRDFGFSLYDSIRSLDVHKAKIFWIGPLGAPRGPKLGCFHTKFCYVASWYSMSWEFDEENDGKIDVRIFELDVRIFEFDVRIFELWLHGCP